MNMPKIGDTIIVRKANGYLPGDLLHSIQIVTDTDAAASIHEVGSGRMSHTGPVVRFQPVGGGNYYTSEWEIVPAVGDRVRAISVPGATGYDGQFCTITDVDPSPTGFVLRGEFASMQKPDDTINLSFSQWEPADEVKPSEETGIISDLQAQVRRLTDEVEAQKVAYTDMVRQRDGWRDDFHHQANCLLDEAEHRGWCNEYEEFCDRVDEGLRFGEMPRREREYEVSWVATVIVQVPMTRTYTARDEESAEASAKEDYDATPESQEIIDAIRAGNWEEQDDAYREYDVEEV